MRKLPEQLADGRRLYTETFDFSTRYDESGVLRTVLRYQPVQEGKGEEKVLGRISGTAAEVDIVNRNHRFYSKPVFEKATERAQSHIVEQRNFLGEVDHPWYGTLAGAAFRFTRLEVVGAFVEFDGVILNTEQGKHLKALMDGGVGVQVSTRGYASSKPEMMEVGGVPVEVDVIQDDLTFEGIDFVLFASNRGGKTKSESTESTTQETAVLTLEQLRKEHQALVATIEAEARVGFIAQAAHDAALAEHTVSLAAADARVAEGVAAHELTKTELSEAKSQLADAVAKVAAFEARDAELEAQRTAEAARATRIAHVEAVLVDFPFADLVRDELIACESNEAVDTAFAARKAAFEKVAARAAVTPEPQGAGIIEENSSVQYTAEQLEQRRLAGLPNPAQ